MAHNNLGVWLKQEGKTREARAQYEEALRIRPGYLEAEDNLGLMLADQGKLPEAIDRYRAAVVSEPRFADAHRNLANVLFHAGRADEAFAQYEEALRLRGDDAHTWNDLGNALFASTGLPKRPSASAPPCVSIPISPWPMAISAMPWSKWPDRRRGERV